MDVVCQAKSGMGKTAVFVLAVLQQMEKKPDSHVHVLVMCHTRELAYQVKNEFHRFTKCANIQSTNLGSCRSHHLTSHGGSRLGRVLTYHAVWDTMPDGIRH